MNICGNCKNYERGNAWSGTCLVGKHSTSPGTPCTIGRFETHPSIPAEAPQGAFRQARYITGVQAYDWPTNATTEWVMRVEVMAIVGAWAMVRWVDAPEVQFSALDHMGYSSAFAARKPFVVETVRLDFGDKSQ